MRKDFNAHRIFLVNKHGRRFIALHTNMAAVTSCENVLAPVVQKADNTISRINLYPLDSAIGFPNIYPLDSDLSGG